MVGFVFLCSACAAPGQGETARVPSVTVAGSPTSVLAGRPGPSGSEPIDRLAPPGDVPVIRDGKKPSPSIHPRAGGFSPTAPARYPDGVSLTVDQVKHGVETDVGPGAFPGRHYTAMSLSLRNRSMHPINVNQVVVTASYGSPARIASPVYEGGAARDFAGTVQPGGSASATYVFAIPPGGGKRVVVVVDFDSTHVSARFTGTTG